jgi:hypothetical protein
MKTLAEIFLISGILCWALAIFTGVGEYVIGMFVYVFVGLLLALIVKVYE